MPFFIQTCASYTNSDGLFRKINGDGGITIWTNLKSQTSCGLTLIKVMSFGICCHPPTQHQFLPYLSVLSCALIAAEATFLWSLLFMSVSCSLCCMGFSSLFCLKSRCAWLVLKFSLHQFFTCKHSLTLCWLFVPCVCSECALQVASNFVAIVCCGFLVGFMFFSALQMVLSLSEGHFPLLVKPQAHFSYHFSLSYLATIWCWILTYPLLTLLWCSNLTNLLFLIPNPLSHY